VRPNSQDVGLEAAIIERVRKSSLVECAGTDNVTRLKPRTEARECCQRVLMGGSSLFERGVVLDTSSSSGRGAFWCREA